jgi:transcription initiation factor TFIIIB Brf1 subunit/transcription initiation factor TFIIB
MQHSSSCPICKSNGREVVVIVTDPQSGEIICNYCGVVISENIQDISKPGIRTIYSPEKANDNRRINIGSRFL